MTVDQIIEKLASCNLKQVHRDTEIPYDRMFKWTKGKGRPKKEDFDTLVKYFSGGNSSKNETAERPKHHDEVYSLLESQKELYTILIAEKDERIKDKEYIIATQEDLIAAKDEALGLWRQKAQDYEKKISIASDDMGTTGHARPGHRRAGK